MFSRFLSYCSHCNFYLFMYKFSRFQAQIKENVSILCVSIFCCLNKSLNIPHVSESTPQIFAKGAAKMFVGPSATAVTEGTMR